MTEYEQTELNRMIEEIGRFDNDYKPESAFQPGLESLANADYDFEIAYAMLERTSHTRDVILRLGLKVLPSGVIREWPQFFTKQAQINRVGAHLVALGYQDFAQAGGFSQKLAKLLPHLKGVRFKATKTSRVGNTGEMYHDLSIAFRHQAASQVMPPAARAAGSSGPPNLPGAPAHAQPSMFGPEVLPAPASKDDIPF